MAHVRTLAGDCTVRYEGTDVREERGAVLVVIKPDGTVLVHDRDGYQPVAWLTRAADVAYYHDGGARIEAVDDDVTLTVVCHTEFGGGHYAVSRAGEHVGECPACGGPLVRAPESVRCLECDDAFGVPRDASVSPEPCPDCDLPTMTVERGARFELCVDRDCDSLDDHVHEAFDREWICPDCGGDLLVLRRGGLIAGCEQYPDCEAGYSIPAGSVAGSCSACGLPRFETADGVRCLDATCGGA